MIAALALACGIASCGGPFLMFPGGELAGDVVSEPVADWSFVSPGVLDLETRPEDPYSVSINFIVREGALHIDPAEGRRWLEHIRADPRVRIRLEGKIYPLRATLVGLPGEIEGFDPTRYVYRLDAR
ncbi:MAG: hypothetical protein JRG86_12305 [Deltaproteobacteria bacterium]|nr:hypothetical protein [Deltaproteobacteria bacterium]MBW2497401.1 hypothetical protein [Deltaproteobacteria bacterium]